MPTDSQSGPYANCKTDEDRAAVNKQIASDILYGGKYGNGTERRKALTDAGYDYAAIQGEINTLLYGKDAASTIKVNASTPTVATPTDSKADYSSAEAKALVEYMNENTNRANTIWNSIKTGMKDVKTSMDYDTFAEFFKGDPNDIDFTKNDLDKSFVDTFLSESKKIIGNNKTASDNYEKRVAELREAGWADDNLFTAEDGPER